VTGKLCPQEYGAIIKNEQASCEDLVNKRGSRHTQWTEAGHQAPLFITIDQASTGSLDRRGPQVVQGTVEKKQDFTA
jgi:hypothetical protein